MAKKTNTQKANVIGDIDIEPQLENDDSCAKVAHGDSDLTSTYGEKKETKPDTLKVDMDGYVFPKRPCPKCNYHLTRAYKTEFPTQYRKCLNCGNSFPNRAVKIK